MAAEQQTEGLIHSTGRKVVQCRGCQANIIFVVTKTEALMPLDVQPQRLVVLNEDGRTIKEIVLGYIPHHSTCPNADRFRGKQTKSKQ